MGSHIVIISRQISGEGEALSFLFLCLLYRVLVPRVLVIREKSIRGSLEARAIIIWMGRRVAYCSSRRFPTSSEAASPKKLGIHSVRAAYRHNKEQEGKQ